MISILVLLSCIVSAARAGEVCCYDTDIVPPEIGCYNDDYPFDNMPLPDCLDVIQPSLRLYTRENPDDGLVVTKTTIPSIFNPNRRTQFLVHGWLGSRRSPWMQTQKDLLLDQGDYNIIIVGWSGGSREIWYPGSASNTKVVGTEIALTALNLVAIGGASMEDMYCTGHSLGGHVCGHAGQRANFYGNFGRITGLDPAGPWFENIDHPDAGLDKTDALTVDVLHTHGVKKVIMNLGTLKPLGHKDFYPNGGGLMPGCLLDPYSEIEEMVGPFDPTPYVDLIPFCSHLRAVAYYRESISECMFYSSQLCSDPYDLPASCVTQPSAVGSMGLHAEDFSTEGIMYLETTNDSPFCTD